MRRSFMEEKSTTPQDLVHIARLALTGREQDIQLYIRRMVRRYKDSLPELAEELKSLLREAPTRQSPLRRDFAAPVPVDLDSRLQLVRHEQVTELDAEPILSDEVRKQLDQLVQERSNRSRLEAAGLTPTKSVLFTGAPGVGKSLCARWLARELGHPLLILDLSAVMSSFLGRTGSNVRSVLDYAKSIDCILLLDELDAVAKRRDDSTEIGELKRLVTVLLQEIDDWPPSGLLIAATNHADLLDPAVWRRFEVLVEFPMPDNGQVRRAIRQFIGEAPVEEVPWLEVLALCLQGYSYSDIQREILNARRMALLADGSLNDLLKTVVQSHIERLSRQAKIKIATELVQSNVVSQREAHELTGVSRDTIRKARGLREDTEAGEAK